MINNRFCCWVWEFIGDEELIIVSRRSFNCDGVNELEYFCFFFKNHIHPHNPNKSKIIQIIMGRVFSSQVQFTKNYSIKKKTPLMRWGLTDFHPPKITQP